MKKLIYLLVIVTSGLLCETTFAQVSFRVNISSQPIWGPVGYDHVDYYYLPDIDAYYYVPRHKYVYMENGNWITRSNLPPRHRDYDMYNARKVVVNEPKPYLHHQDFKARYGSSDDRSNQPSIRDSHEPRYFENKNHPEHSKWKASRRSQIESQQQRTEGRGRRN
jgi:hypothetical protein